VPGWPVSRVQSRLGRLLIHDLHSGMASRNMEGGTTYSRLV
jgi:hypothetical protein